MSKKSIKQKIESYEYDRIQLSFKLEMCQLFKFDAEDFKINNDIKWISKIIDELQDIESLKLNPETVKEFVIKIHMAGQRSGGVDPSVNEANAYYESIKNSNEPFIKFNN